jgi:hypothetical protein
VDPANSVPTSSVSEALIISESDGSPLPSQLTREQFLSRLHEATTSAADDLLGPEWIATGCPYLDRWFAEHADTDGATLERLARRYAAVGEVSSAAELIAGVVARLRGSIERWRSGGDIRNEIVVAGLSLAEPPGEPVAPVQAKRAPGEARRSDGPGTGTLGQGVPLDVGVAGRFGAAFGADFGHVRVHHDAKGARSATTQGALAYTLGDHIAFAEGRYQPGTLAGDALLAHELAHVLQQRGSADRAPQASMGEDSAPEVEADHAAVLATARLYGAPAARAASSPIRLRIGPLKLQRCKSKKDVTPPPPQIATMDATQLKAIIDSPATHSFGEVAAASARSMMLAQQAGVADSGQGPFMGSHETPPAPEGVTKTDCTDYVLKVLGNTFRAQGQGTAWNSVYTAAQAGSGEKFKGIELLKALQQQLGWKAVFWGPDPRNPADSLSEHPDAYRKVRETGTYYGVTVDTDKSVVEYRRTNPAQPVKTAQLEKLRKVPFGVIAAKGGYHMTVLINGIVYEAHWEALPTDPNVIQATPLDTWPDWQSGVIVMPAGDVDKAWKD